MRFLTRTWAGLKSFGRRVATFEPARVRAVWSAVVLLAATLGITVSAEVDGKVVGAIGALSVLIPLVQGLWTRASVVPVAKYEALRDGYDAATAALAAQQPRPQVPGTVGVDQPHPYQP